MDAPLRHPRSRAGPAGIGLHARRQARARRRDVHRHPRLHHARGNAAARGDDRAAQYLLHADVRRDQRPWRHRDADGRRRPDGGVRRTGAAARSVRQRRAHGARDDRDDRPLQPGARRREQAADQDRHRHRFRRDGGGLRRHQRARDVHVHRRHRQSRIPARVAHQGGRAHHPHRCRDPGRLERPRASWSRSASWRSAARPCQSKCTRSISARNSSDAVALPRRTAHTRERFRSRLCSAARHADPLSASHPGVLPGTGLRRSVRVGALRGSPVPTAARPAVPLPDRADHHGGALSAGRGRPGARCPLQRESEVLHRLLGRLGAGPRAADFARRHRSHAHDGGRPGNVVPAAGVAATGRRRPDRAGGAAFPRHADEPQSPRHARTGLPGDRRPLYGRRRRCGDPRSQLPGLPPDGEPRRAHVGGKRHRDGRHGLREGHRGVRRHSALPLFRLPLGQQRGSAAGSRIAGVHARARVARARGSPGTADHRAIPARLELQSRLEARLLQHRAPLGGRDRATCASNSTRGRRKPADCATNPSPAAAGAAAGTPRESRASTGAAR